MSVEATALSRSKLEQKDRSELAAIVEAMGGKAGSRAKKADLVELVLELAGASPPPPTAVDERVCQRRRRPRCGRACSCPRGRPGPR